MYNTRDGDKPFLESPMQTVQSVAEPEKSDLNVSRSPPVKVEYSNREGSSEPNMDMELSPTAYNKENGRFFDESKGLAT